ncbi:hypothetical protein D3C72_2234200 [compost metagenome]
MELGCFQVWQIVLKLMSKPTEALNTAQIAGALQRLKKQGLIEHKQGQWRFVEPEMYKAQQDAAIKRATQEAKQGEPDGQ